ncbi:uncharacterized protein BXIN_1395 [Babesia sp. Xinjiang]|uniref:uncharacterized protein n=1 Tax=Babesia sp. Xinjiang TaxID=462227 RepID=UPI000A25E4CD|nr:uncharacterized protein BXIN_1395 [Babesia sp. Xinjiang]ORM39966.1 hypothetical protein BXIN_1395 [Babesia sp. Xinjiang]
MERAVRNFIIIISMDILVFVTSVIIWCRKRTKIIDIIRNGFQGLHMVNHKKRKDDQQNQDGSNTIHQVKYMSSYDGGSEGTDIDDEGEKSDIGTDGRYGDDASTTSALYVAPEKSRKDADVRRATAMRGNKTWWYHLIYSKDGRIRNNEAVLYLKFIRSTCIMLLICSFVALVSNIIIFTHLALNNKPQFLFTYSIEDMRSCKLTVWTLYATTWIYSIIVYVHIFKFRRKVNRGKQITVMLRPQLHTIMICGFDKNITDPTKFYRHFEQYFPEHVLSVHIVFNHSKRMQLEEELTATKAQLCLCRDMSLLVNKNRKGKPETPRADTEAKEPQPPPSKPRRSQSCGGITPPDNLNVTSDEDKQYRATVSSSNLISQPKEAKREPTRSTVTLRKGFMRGVTRILVGKEAEVQRQQDYEHEEDFGERFVDLLGRVKELKARIEEEVNREHVTSARVCFVSFADSNIVMHILRDRNILEAIPEWRIRPAPHPRDIIWRNLHLPRYSIIIRMLACNLLLVVFYVIITWILSHLNLLQTVKSKEAAEGTATQVKNKYLQVHRGLLSISMTLLNAHFGAL